MELLALFVEDLVGILLTSAHTLQLGEVLAIWQSILQLYVLVLVSLELCANVLECETPLFLQQVVLF